MDLALEFGCTVDELGEAMTERELRQWQAYARKRWLPGRRLELLLANIARMTAGSDSLVPFIFDPALREALTPKTVATATVAASAFAAIAGTGRIFRLGQKRKKVANG
jgi:hypothetical protein